MLDLFGKLLHFLGALGIHLQVFGTLELLVNKVASLEVENSWQLAQVGDQVGVAYSKNHVSQRFLL